MRVKPYIFLVSAFLPLAACSMSVSVTPTPTDSFTPTPTPELLCNSTDWCAAPLSPSLEPQATSSLNVITYNNELFLLIEDRRFESVIDSETVPIDNCSGPAGITITPSLSKSYTSAVEIGTSASIDLGEIIKLSIAAHYEINISETKEYVTSAEFVAPPGVIVHYSIIWLEDVIEGRIIPIGKLESGELEEIPYRAKSKIHVNIPSPIPLSCPQTPTLIPTETFTPLPTTTFTPSLTATPLDEATASQTPNQ